MINYHNKKFRPVFNADNGETSADTVFHYQQNQNVLTGTYSGGKIIDGHLMALIDEKGSLEMSYHQINSCGQLMTGICKSIPEVMANGKIRLHETWQWTSGDYSAGTSVLEEI